MSFNIFPSIFFIQFRYFSLLFINLLCHFDSFFLSCRYKCFFHFFLASWYFFCLFFCLFLSFSINFFTLLSILLYSLWLCMLLFAAIFFSCQLCILPLSCYFFSFWLRSAISSLFNVAILALCSYLSLFTLAI